MVDPLLPGGLELSSDLDSLSSYSFESFSCYYGKCGLNQASIRQIKEYSARDYPINNRYGISVVISLRQSITVVESENQWTIGGEGVQRQSYIALSEMIREIVLDERAEVLWVHLPMATIVSATGVGATGEALRLSDWTLESSAVVADSTVLALGEALIDWLDSTVAIASLYRSSLIRLLLVHIVAKYAQVEESPIDSLQVQGSYTAQSNKVAIALRHIQSNLDKPLKVKELAEIVGLSQSHFSRVFKRSVGITPRRYILSERIKLAKLLLEDSQMNLSEISFRCGFYDQSHFILQFRRAVGMTPKVYRSSL